MKHYTILLLIITIILSCKKDIIDNNQNGNLHFSHDTIIFDTTFHSVGTTTQTLTIYNRNDFNISTNISLDINNSEATNNGSGGAFRINVDGVPTNLSINNVEILANDSIFIFLEATPNINNENIFLLTNNLIFRTGSNNQTIKLVVPGRNANFHLPHDNIFILNDNSTINLKYHSITTNETWTNDLPHVIYGQVVIEPNASLTIEEGTIIHFHNNSGIFVGNPILINPDGTPPLNNGTLTIKGTIGNEVVMQGDRLDSHYEDIAGQWKGIYFVPGSINSTINYARIKNGTTAIRADSVVNNNPTIIISNTIIENMSSIGILGQGTKIVGENIVISKCGQYAVACNIGGDYSFTHCTFANYWNQNSRSTPSILLNNYYEDINGNLHTRDLNTASFNNCIIYGNLSTEISFQNEESGVFNYMFNHNLIRLDPKINTNNSYYNNNIINQTPEFIDKYNNDFHLSYDSPAIDVGDPTIQINDIENNIRNNPDLGAFEYQN